MATTTTNFGWDIPQSTDLVKDGATAIAALGQDIDTAFVDLKGGTTGQVLAKASNTDLDYTWVAQDDSNAIQNAIVDAKGDLITATSADTPARLAVGNNGEVLVADSTTSTGLRYQGHIEAGKNALINGGMDIWQRGTSSTTNLTYLADRWFQYTSAGTTTFSRESSIVPTGSTYSMKIAQATANATITVNQAIETLNAAQYAGQTINISAMVYASASTGMQIQLGYSTSTDVGPLGSWTNISATTGGAATATTSWQKMYGTYAVPSTAKSLYVSIFIPTLTSGTSAYFGQTMLELGSVPTSFSRTGGTISGELAACQRYYERLTADTAYGSMGTGISNTSTTATSLTPFKVTKRITPTVIDTSAASGFQLDDGANGYTASAITIAAAYNSTQWGAIAVTSSGMTQYRPCWLVAKNSSTAYIGFSAEL